MPLRMVLVASSGMVECRSAPIPWFEWVLIWSECEV